MIILKEKKEVVFERENKRIEVYNDFIHVLTQLKNFIVENMDKQITDKIKKDIKNIDSKNVELKLFDRFDILYYLCNKKGFYLPYSEIKTPQNSLQLTINRHEGLPAYRSLGNEKTILYIDNVIEDYKRNIKLIEKTLKNYNDMILEYERIYALLHKFNENYDETIRENLGLTTNKLP